MTGWSMDTLCYWKCKSRQGCGNILVITYQPNTLDMQGKQAQYPQVFRPQKLEDTNVT